MSDRPAIPFEEMLSRLPADEREELEQVYRESFERYQGLKDLREALAKTQTEVAGRMGITHPALSKMERKADLYVGTLRKAIEAMGGRLDVIARFPGRRPVRIGRFSGTGEGRPDQESS